MIDKAHLILLAGAALVGASFSAPSAQASTCQFAMPRDVVVSLARRDGEIRFDNSRSRADLARLQKRTGGGAFGAGWTPVGLTLTELKYAMRVKVEAIPTSGGRYCARLTEVDAELGFERMDIYVANNFRPGGCAYSSINEHELTHVAVFRKTLDAYYPRMLSRMERSVREADPVHAESPNAAATLLQSRLRASIDPLFKEMNRTMDRDNARLDTPERYRAEQARCAEW